MNVAEIVEEARAASGNQLELSRRMGVTQSAISRWAAGQTVPAFDSCLRLAQITGRPAADVLRAAGHDPSLLPRGDPEAPTEGVAETARLKQTLKDVMRLVEPFTRSSRARSLAT